MAIVAKYSLNGNANDSAGSNNGTPTDLTYVAWKSGEAWSFNWTSTLITAWTTLWNFWTADFTINTFFNLSWSWDRWLINKTDSIDTNWFSFYVSWWKLQGFTVSLTGYRDVVWATTLSNSVWYMWTLVRRAWNLEIYLNAKNDFWSSPSWVWPARDMNNANNFELWRLRNSNARWMNWEIDEVDVYNTALTPAEIKNKYLFYNWFM